MRRRPRQAATEQERRVAEVLFRESIYDSPREFFDAILLRLPPEEPLEAATVRRLVSHLRGHYGEGSYRAAEASAEAERFWKTLADRTGSPCALACYAETLLTRDGSRRAEALDLLLAGCERDPILFCEFAGDFYEVAESLGGARRLGFQIAALRAALAEGDDEVREMYSELLEEHAPDPEAAARVREVGAEIERAVADGTLPRALVRRGIWREEKRIS